MTNNEAKLAAFFAASSRRRGYAFTAVVTASASSSPEKCSSGWLIEHDEDFTAALASVSLRRRLFPSERGSYA
jgi:hypothetical protein